jgi:hypothetical protein
MPGNTASQTAKTMSASPGRDKHPAMKHGVADSFSYMFIWMFLHQFFSRSV